MASFSGLKCYGPTNYNHVVTTKPVNKENIIDAARPQQDGAGMALECSALRQRLKGGVGAAVVLAKIGHWQIETSTVVYQIRTLITPMEKRHKRYAMLFQAWVLSN